MGEVKLFGELKLITMPKSERRAIQHSINRSLANNTARHDTEPFDADDILRWKQYYLSGLPISQLSEMEQVSEHRIRNSIGRKGTRIAGKYWVNLHKINKLRQIENKKPMAIVTYQKMWNG